MQRTRLPSHGAQMQFQPRSTAPTLCAMNFTAPATRQISEPPATANIGLSQASNTLKQSAIPAWGIGRVGQPDAPGAGKKASQAARLGLSRMFGSANTFSGGAPDSRAV